MFYRLECQVVDYIQIMQKKPLSLTKLSSSQAKRTSKLQLNDPILKTMSKNTPKSRLMINSPKRILLPFPEEPFFKRVLDTKVSRPKKRTNKAVEAVFSLEKLDNKREVPGLNATKMQKLDQVRLNPCFQNRSSGRLLSKPQDYKQLQAKLSKLQSRITYVKSGMDRDQEHKSSKPQKTLLKSSMHVQSKNKMHSEQKTGSKGKRVTEDPNSESLSNLVTQAHNKCSHNDLNQDPYSQTNGCYYTSLVSKCYTSEHLPLVREHISQCLHTMKFLKNSRRPSEKEVEGKKVFLAQKERHKGQLTVILDLDQTLIHCNESPEMKCDALLPIKFPNGQSIRAGINIRPFCVQFLKLIAQTCEIIIFTASHSSYANVVLNHLDPSNECISHRLYRQNCHQTEDGIFVKDLRIINRDPRRMVLVDNASYSYFFQLDNGIPIVPFYKGKNDYQLKYLVHYIHDLESKANAMEHNGKYFQLGEYFQFKDAKSLIRKLYPQMLGNKKSL